MSIPSVYLKSERDQLTLTKTPPPIPYEYTLFHVNYRAIPVTRIDISNNIATFLNGNTEYIRYNVNVIEEKTPSGWQERTTYFNNDYEGIRVYKNNLFQSVITSSILTKNEASDIAFNQILTNITMFIRINPTIDTFRITIPNDKPTNRIFVYQTNNNRLLHITDYIPKGSTQKVTINYTNNNGVLNVTSSVVPVNPLPVPNFNIQYGEDSNSDKSLYNYAKMEYESSSYTQTNFTETTLCGKKWIYNQNDITCPKGEILSNNASRCANIYSENIRPIKSITYNVDNGTEPVLYSDNSGTSVNCEQGVVTRYMRRGWGYTSASIRGSGCRDGPQRHYNRHYRTRCARLSIE